MGSFKRRTRPLTAAFEASAPSLPMSSLVLQAPQKCAEHGAVSSTDQKDLVLATARHDRHDVPSARCFILSLPFVSLPP